MQGGRLKNGFLLMKKKILFFNFLRRNKLRLYACAG